MDHALLVKLIAGAIFSVLVLVACLFISTRGYRSTAVLFGVCLAIALTCILAAAGFYAINKSLLEFDYGLR